MLRPVVAVVAAMLGCKGVEHPRATVTKRDPHTFADPTRVAITHLALELAVDFTTRTLAGTASLTLARFDRAAPVVLDTDHLTIESVTECASRRALPHTLGTPDPVRGQALSVTLRDEDCIAVTYRTGPDAGALLWVEPAGTSGKQHPMLFTQSQAILARTWIPLQDTPGVRFTYDATIRTPPALRAVMSAENPRARTARGWVFRMTHPIPSYLMALAVGDLAFQPIGTRTGVYAEPAVVAAAAREFVEVDAMIAAAEKLYGPYRWGRYDMLVLPPSFPYGGMENPRLTFLTPTVITGDRALVSLIAHELAHSWSGNLVTNSTWSDLWLNEGFTSYVERRIMEELRGREVIDVHWYLARKDLDRLTADRSVAAADTRLALDIPATRDPDDVPATSAYDKGALFLRALEEAAGRPTFDAFVRRWFDGRAFQSTDSAAFEAEVAALVAHAPKRIDVARWLHEPGIPIDAPASTSTRATMLESRAGALATTGELPDAAGWDTLDWVVFLRALPEVTPLAQLQALDARFKLTATTNPEILTFWLPRLIKADARDAAPRVEAFLLEVGRRRMVRPVYTALVTTNPFWRQLATTIFARARSLYHPITRDTVEKLLAGAR